MEGFTLQSIAFPIAPPSLDGFTVDGLAWVEVEAAPEPGTPVPAVFLAVPGNRTFGAAPGNRIFLSRK